MRFNVFILVGIISGCTGDAAHLRLSNSRLARDADEQAEIADISEVDIQEEVLLQQTGVDLHELLAIWEDDPRPPKNPHTTTVRIDEDEGEELSAIWDGPMRTHPTPITTTTTSTPAEIPTLKQHNFPIGDDGTTAAKTVFFTPSHTRKRTTQRSDGEDLPTIPNFPIGNGGTGKPTTRSHIDDLPILTEPTLSIGTEPDITRIPRTTLTFTAGNDDDGPVTPRSTHRLTTDDDEDGFLVLAPTITHRQTTDKQTTDDDEDGFLVLAPTITHRQTTDDDEDGSVIFTPISTHAHSSRTSDGDELPTIPNFPIGDAERGPPTTGKFDIEDLDVEGGPPTTQKFDIEDEDVSTASEGLVDEEEILKTKWFIRF